MSESELEEKIVGLYAGPLDAFVARRDALVKELRAGGDREAATGVKNLRKPSRAAWALDLGVLGTPHAMQTLEGALNETLAAHAGNGDVRTAMTGLRNAMRDLAAHAARAAEREGLPVEAAVLATALQSVLGSQESLQLLRRGCLAEVPESDGLDFLASLPSAPRKAAPAGSPQSHEQAAREEELERARRAEAAIAAARERAAAAQQALRDAEARLKAAEKTLREAEASATTARSEVQRARRHAETAASELRELE
jgi:hypothetical protein